MLFTQFTLLDQCLVNKCWRLLVFELIKKLKLLGYVRMDVIFKIDDEKSSLLFRKQLHTCVIFWKKEKERELN